MKNFRSLLMTLCALLGLATVSSFSVPSRIIRTTFTPPFSLKPRNIHSIPPMMASEDKSSSNDDGVVELLDDDDDDETEPESSATANDSSAAPFLSQGEIVDEALNPDLSDPKQARVIIYIIISLIPVLFLIPLMLGSRDLIPLDALPPVEIGN